MSSMPNGVRLGLAAASSLLLVLGAACSSDDRQTSPSPSATPSAEASTAAPGPSVTPSTTLPPPATTPVPQPTPGSVDSTVPSEPEKSLAPVPLDDSKQTGTGVTVKLTELDSIRAKAQLPGEVSGPALAVTVSAKNTGSSPIDLNATVVNLYDSDNVPGGEMTAKPADPLDGKLAPGKSAKGVYVFTVAKGKRDPVKITVTIGDAPVLVFTGKAP